MKDNGFKLAKKRSRRYPAQTIKDADYANDIALLENTRGKAETLFWRQIHKNAASNTEQLREAALRQAAAVRPPTSHHENYRS